MASTPPTEEAFMREVDEELRREQMETMWKRYGRIALIAVAVFLIAFAGFLFWKSQREKAREAQGEQMATLLADMQSGRRTDAGKKADALIADGGPGYRAAALLAKAALAADSGDAKAAGGLYARIAADDTLPQPYRDLATIRQTLIDYDTLAPQQVIDRMKPIAVEENGFFGAAGELTALAMIRTGRGAEAGRLLATIARDTKSPASLRARAAQLATSLGADVGTLQADKD